MLMNPGGAARAKKGPPPLSIPEECVSKGVTNMQQGAEEVAVPLQCILWHLPVALRLLFLHVCMLSEAATHSWSQEEVPKSEGPLLASLPVCVSRGVGSRQGGAEEVVLSLKHAL